jgi:hypothetical protein
MIQVNLKKNVACFAVTVLKYLVRSKVLTFCWEVHNVVDSKENKELFVFGHYKFKSHSNTNPLNQNVSKHRHMNYEKITNTYVTHISSPWSKGNF